MNAKFEIIEKAIGPVIEIEEQTKVMSMPATFGRDYKRIMDYIASQGAEYSDMPYARYLDMDWEKELGKGKLAMFFDVFTKTWHYYAGIPSSKPLPGEGRLKFSDYPKRRYARAVHYGPYQESGKTYKALYQWAGSQGYTLANEAIEFYVNDPSEVSKEEIETIILIPLDE